MQKWIVTMLLLPFLFFSVFSCDLFDSLDQDGTDGTTTDGELSNGETDDTTDDQSDDTDDTSSDYEPLLSGLSFELSEGTFWDFSWEKYDSSAYRSSSSTTTGAFKVVLGESTTISGVTMYEVDVIGRTSDMAPEWNYLGVAEDILYGSESGYTLVELFNGLTGSWQGNTFFGPIYTDDSYYYAAESSVISTHPILSGSAFVVGEGSTDSSSHTYIDGYGYVYTGDPDMSSNKQNYYTLEAGPYGYYWYFNYSDYSSQSTSRDYIGLEATSLRGDVPFIPMEEEPNEEISTDLALLERGVPVIGKIMKGDTIGRIETVYYQGDTYFIEAEDYYQIILEWGGPTNESDWTYITLEYDGEGEIDMYLLQPLEAGEYDVIDASDEPSGGGALKESIGYFFEGDNTDGIPLYIAVVAHDDVTEELTYTITYN